MRIHHLNCVSACPLGGALMDGVSRRSLRGRLTSHCLLVELDDTLVLVDTGYGLRDVHDPASRLSWFFLTLNAPELREEMTAIRQVEALGFDPRDVRHIVLSHLDFDHAGGLADFPRAKIHLHAREHAAAMARRSFLDKQRYHSAQWSHGAKWEVYAEDGDTWRGLPAITRLRGIDADIGLVPMHGHTRGHSAVVVMARDDRWLMHAGDAYFHRNAIEGGERVPPGVAAFESINQTIAGPRRASVAAIRQLCSSYRDLDVFCSHDEREYAAMRGRA
jgi:glyoxylase-like metal-dependent hydrolase (beta-lactamase superfamily II)